MKSMWLSLVVVFTMLSSVFYGVAVTLAALLPEDTPLIIVTGSQDLVSTGGPEIASFRLGPEPMFDQVSGGVFSAFLVNPTFAGEALVDLAIQGLQNVDNSYFFSLPNPANFIDFRELSELILFGQEPVPPPVGNYYNTLTLQWKVLDNLLNLPVTNLRANVDGVVDVPISPATLLLGTGLMGFITIARRSFFKIDQKLVHAPDHLYKEA